MKFRSRFASISALALTLFIVSAPLAAYPRERRDRDEPPIYRILKKISKFFGIAPNEDLPGPPRP